MNIHLIHNPALDAIEISIQTPTKNDPLALQLIQHIQLDLTQLSIWIKQADSYIQTPIADVILIYAEDKQIKAKTKTFDGTLKASLKVLESNLKPYGWVRINNSELISIHWIDRIDTSYSGTIKITLKNGETVYASRRSIKAVKAALNL